MDRRVAVVAGEQVYDAVVSPGSTAHDVLAQVGLTDEYFLSKRDGLPFGSAEEVYGAVRDGEKLHASTKATVGTRGKRGV